MMDTTYSATSLNLSMSTMKLVKLFLFAACMTYFVRSLTAYKLRKYPEGSLFGSGAGGKGTGGKGTRLAEPWPLVKLILPPKGVVGDLTEELIEVEEPFLELSPEVKE